MQQSAWNTIASLVLLTILGGCGPGLERPEEVSNIIRLDSMSMIMTDIHLIEGAKVGENIMGDSLRAAHYFRSVYDKYQISQARFEESFDYYSERPDEMNKIYEAVIEELTRMEKSPPRESLLEEDQ